MMMVMVGRVMMMMMLTTSSIILIIDEHGITLVGHGRTRLRLKDRLLRLVLMLIG